MAKAIKWSDGFGKTGWQPETDNGEALWRSYGWRYADRFDYTAFENEEPKLYKSRERALKIAENREAELSFERLKRFRRIG